MPETQPSSVPRMGPGTCAPGTSMCSCSTIRRVRIWNTGSIWRAAGSGSCSSAIRPPTRSGGLGLRATELEQSDSRRWEKVACGAFSDSSSVSAGKKRGFCRLRRTKPMSHMSDRPRPGARLSVSGRVDRHRLLSFVFEGRALTGYAGDTLASALLANGASLIGRSFKYHRPRGFLSSGIEEPNGLLTLGTDGRRTPNVPATATELCDGLICDRQNGWPSVEFDLMSITGRLASLLEAGFYYKTFMGPRRRSWLFYEPVIRRAAGPGRAPPVPAPHRYLPP